MGKNVKTKFSADNLKIASEIMRALAHNKRLHILAFIAHHEPVCVNDIYTGLRLEQSVTSQHLRVLRMANLVSTSRNGKFVYYHLNNDHLHKAVEAGKVLAVMVDEAGKEGDA